MPISDPKRSDRLTVLIVGCGQIAGGYDQPDGPEVKTHAKAYRDHGGFELVACVDPSPGRARQFAATWEIDRAFETLDEAAGRRYDLVSLCSPPEHHAEQLTSLLSWDVGLVFCEKPLTDDIERSRQIVEAYRAQDRCLAVNYLRRWEISARRVREEIAEGVWGALLCAHGLYTKGIYANGSHLIDFAQYLLGPLAPLQATSWRIDHQQDDPTIAGRLATSEGAPVTLAIGDARLYSVFELDLLFEKGRITFGDSGWTLCRRRAVADARFSGYTSLEPAIWEPTSMDDTMRLAVADLHAIANTSRQPPSTGETALAAHEVCRRLHDLMKGESRE